MRMAQEVVVCSLFVHSKNREAQLWKKGDAHKYQLIYLKETKKALKLTVVCVANTVSSVSECMREKTVCAMLFSARKPTKEQLKSWKVSQGGEPHTGLLQSTGTPGPGVASVDDWKQATPSLQRQQQSHKQTATLTGWNEGEVQWVIMPVRGHDRNVCGTQNNREYFWAAATENCGAVRRWEIFHNKKTYYCQAYFSEIVKSYWGLKKLQELKVLF